MNNQRKSELEKQKNTLKDIMLKNLIDKEKEVSALI